MKTLNSFIACMTLLLAVTFMSCEKENIDDDSELPKESQKLTLEQLEVGETYPFDQLAQSVIDILEIDVNSKKRGVVQKILHYPRYAVNNTRIEVDYPGGYVHDLNSSWLLWQKNPSINGTYVYSWHGDSADTQQLKIKRYTITNGNLTVNFDYTLGSAFNSLNGIAGEVDFWDGGWLYGTMSMN